MLKSILQGIADTTQSDSSVTSMVEDEHSASLSLSIAQAELSPLESGVPVQKVTSSHAETDPTSKSDLRDSNKMPVAQPPETIPVQDGGYVKIKYDLNNFKETYLDEYTREALPHHLVRAAIQEELD